MQTKKQYISDKIDFIKDLQSCEEYNFIRDCYDGMIDDLEILILNLEDDDELLVDEAEYQEHMAEQINNQRELEDSQI